MDTGDYFAIHRISITASMTVAREKQLLEETEKPGHLISLAAPLVSSVVVRHPLLPRQFARNHLWCTLGPRL